MDPKPFETTQPFDPTHPAQPTQAARAALPAQPAQPAHPTQPAGSTRAEERRARADWLITELRRRAADTDDPAERHDLRRSSDSLVRLATALRG
ncbi:hypothetical protein [Kribbella monticola]|uniref:hypothetical protein n=1 Tax=Kribbella monticola TaxID=2185285 RepID=UPI000DD2C0A9|nr:hypothetical protein [Kribbella monticola]